MTAEETELARRICAKHAKTFKLLAETIKNDDDQAAVAEDLETILASQAQTVSLPLEVTLQSGEEIAGANVREFFVAALTHLDEQGLLSRLEIPYSTGGSKRWFLNDQPIHQGGHAFKRAAKFEPNSPSVEPFFVEVNVSRSRALKDVKKLLRSAGVQVV